MRNIFYFNFETKEKKFMTSFTEIQINMNKLNHFISCDLDLIDFEIIARKYNLICDNQFDFIQLFFDKFGIEKIDELKGSYAIVYFYLNKIYIFRDLIGIKPICFEKEILNFKFDLDFRDKNFFNSFFFSSELKLLKNGIELNPKEYLVISKDKNCRIGIEILERKSYYRSKPIIDGDYVEIKNNVFEMFESNIKKCIGNKTDEKFGILFSGGTDSTLMALILKKLKIDFICYTASIIGGNITEGEDIYYARKISVECNFNWSLVELDVEDVDKVTKEVIRIIDNSQYTKISVAMPLYVALKQAKKDGIKYVFTGIGSEEIFADYKRDIDVIDINETCIEGLKSLWIRDLYRDNNISVYNNIELKFPFLNNDFVNYCIRINPKFKLDKEFGINKIILRDILRDLGLSEKMVSRTKKAAQYGSRSDRIYEKLAKKAKKTKQEYLNDLSL